MNQAEASEPTKAAPKKPARASLFQRHENLKPFSIFLGFIVIIILLQLYTQGLHKYPTFISPVNLLNVMQQVAVPGMVAVGMTFVMLSGGIDLSVGMLASLVSIIVANGISTWGLGVPASIALGVGSAVLLEFLMGYIISRTSVEPFIITLGGMITFQGLALLLCNSREVILNGELDFIKKNLIAGTKDPVTGLNLIIPPYVLVFFLTLLVGGLVLRFTKFGRRIYAVGTNPHAAYLAGINVKNTRLMVYVIMGFLVGIGATMLLSRINTGIVTLGQNLEIDTIAMVVIGGTALRGGKGSMLGTLIGVFFLGSIGNAMNMLRLPSEVQFLAKGLVVIIAVSAGDVTSRVGAYFTRQKEKALARKIIQG